MLVKRASICFLLIFLGACGKENSTQAIFDNYLYRLSNTLDVETDSDIYHNDILRYPSKSQLIYAIPRASINILEFLQLSPCGLQRLIGERNSSLGKLMDGYHRLLYDVKFIRLAEKCLADMEPEDELYKELQILLNYKKKYLKQMQWNATFATKEFAQLFSTSAQILTPIEIESRASELIQGLEYLIAWQISPSVASPKLEQAFRAIETGKYLGRVRLTMRSSVQMLRQADTLLKSRLDERPLCFKGRGNRRFDTLKNVFQQFYIAEVQLRLTQLHRQSAELLERIHRLQSQGVPNAAFTAFWNEVYISENSEWQVFNRSVLQHSKSWQAIFKQCGYVPGGDARS